MASPHVAGVAALGLEIAPNSSVAQISNWITSTATPGVIADAGTGSPNLLVYSRLSASPPGASAPTTTLPTTTLPTTTVPAGDDGGGGGSGGDGDDGGDDAPGTTTTIARPIVTTSTVPSTTVPQIQASTPIDDLSKLLPVNRMLNPILGSQIPMVVAQAVFAPSSNKVVGNNVVLKVNAPAQSMVHVYRNGILVKSVPAAAAQSIKIAKNRVGNSSFQILIVDKKGVITTTKKSTVRVQKASK